MKRLVYSPKVYVFVKADDGIHDLTPHVIDCSVTRKVNQVSSASVTFRNPNMMFTNGKNGATFHPMDPIVIFMKRLDNRPVQVFTGYCDSTPYFQLKPAPATITASCTLKRLLYTYWDPGLPFVQEVLAQRGWSTVGREGGLGIANLNPNDDPDDDDDNNNDNNDQNGNNLPEVSDGSIGALLFDILLYIGNWDPSTIFIEPIPENVYEVAESLIAEMNDANKDARKEFNKLLKYIIGEDGYGGANPAAPSGPSSGNLGGVQGTGITQSELRKIRDHIYAGGKTTPGQYEATAYGPPWNAMQGTGITSTGISLGPDIKRYLVAIDPSVNNYGKFVYIWPNPFNWTGAFITADTGGAIVGRRIDFYDWRGRSSQYGWGRRQVKLSNSPIVGNVPNSSGAGQPGANTG